MPEIQCSQHECWLKKLCMKRPGQSCPRFCIGEEVEAFFFSEEQNREISDRGVVVGLTSEMPECLVPGWIYFIKFSHSDESDWMPFDHCDWVLESEVRGKGDAL